MSSQFEGQAAYIDGRKKTPLSGVSSARMALCALFEEGRTDHHPGTDTGDLDFVALAPLANLLRNKPLRMDRQELVVGSKANPN